MDWLTRVSCTREFGVSRSMRRGDLCDAGDVGIYGHRLD